MPDGPQPNLVFVLFIYIFSPLEEHDDIFERPTVDIGGDAAPDDWQDHRQPAQQRYDHRRRRPRIVAEFVVIVLAFVVVLIVVVIAVVVR